MQASASFQTAVMAFRSGNTDRTIALCQSLLLQSFQDPRLHHLLGLAFQKKGNLSGACTSLAQAARIAPGEPLFHKDLAVAALQHGDPRTAVSAIDKARGLVPKDPGILAEQATILAQAGQQDRALEILRGLIAQHPAQTMLKVRTASLLRKAGHLQEAEKMCRAVVAELGTEAGAWVNLANVLRDQKRLDEALETAQKALALSPTLGIVHITLGEILSDLGRYEEAMAHFQQSGTVPGAARVVECLLYLERWEDAQAALDERAAALAASGKRPGPLDLRHAAASAYLADRLAVPNQHAFCPDPIQNVRVFPNLGQETDQSAFLETLIAEMTDRDADWNPDSQTTKKGFQTPGNLFVNASESLMTLERYIRDALTQYREAIAGSGMGLATQWPQAFDLTGWFVELRSGGYQDPHIHPEGWVSGVLYLRMPEPLDDPEEGCIQFTLQGDCFPVCDETPSASHLHRSAVGELVLFPSSLYHRTMPFHRDESRMCIAFDMLAK